VRHKPRIHCRAGSTNRRAQLVGQCFEDLEILAIAHAPSARHNDARRSQLGTRGFGEFLTDEFRHTRISRWLEILYAGGTAFALDRVEACGAHRDDLEAVARLYCRERISRIDRPYK